MVRVLIAAAALAFTGCGYVGDPLPPALNIPDPVKDLSAVQRGDRIILDYTAPLLTTEAIGITSFPAAELQIDDRVVPIASPEPGETAHVELPAAQWAGKEVVIQVVLSGPKGRKSAASNLVTLRVLQPLPVPSAVKAESHPEGVRLSWTSDAKQFRISRIPEASASMDASEYIDRAVETGKTYSYTVVAVSGGSESNSSPPVSVVPKDTFEPAAPANLTAIAGVNTIELAWDRNTEADLRGYRVYRNDQSIAGDLAAPSFSDKVTSGQTYRYAITAVDRAGNESSRSAAIEITAP